MFFFFFPSPLLLFFLFFCPYTRKRTPFIWPTLPLRKKQYWIPAEGDVAGMTEKGKERSHPARSYPMRSRPGTLPVILKVSAAMRQYQKAFGHLPLFPE